MGTRVFGDTAVISNPSTAPANPSVRKLGGAVDFPLLLIMIAFLVFGLLMVFSASWDFSLGTYGDAMRMFYRQVLWMVMGILAASLLSLLDYHKWRQLAVPVMLFTIILLSLVLLLNDERLGAVRTIFGGSIQPSELAKVITVIYLSVWMHSKREQLHDIQ